MVFNLGAFATIWTILGIAFERIGLIFNDTMKVFPTFQDAVTGFSMMQVAWSAIAIIFFLAIIFNYISNESQMILGEQ